MTKNEEKLISVIQTLCDAIFDNPCGCDACPYCEYEEQCEVYNLIEEIKVGGNIELSEHSESQGNRTGKQKATIEAESKTE